MLYKIRGKKANACYVVYGTQGHNRVLSVAHARGLQNQPRTLEGIFV
jgi:hypothetical protein